MITYLIALTLALAQPTTAKGWWNDKEKDAPKEETHSNERPPAPFDRIYIEPFCYRIFDDEQYRTRTSTEKFFLTPAKKACVLKGSDEVLGLKVRLEFCNNNKLMSCKVKHGEDLYFPSDIWMMELGPAKCIYIFSFKESDASLIIQKSKHHTATAQWVLLHEFTQKH